MKTISERITRVKTEVSDLRENCDSSVYVLSFCVFLHFHPQVEHFSLHNHTVPPDTYAASKTSSVKAKAPNQHVFRVTVCTHRSAAERLLKGSVQHLPAKQKHQNEKRLRRSNKVFDPCISCSYVLTSSRSAQLLFLHLCGSETGVSEDGFL